MNNDLNEILTELHGLFNSDRKEMITRCEQLLTDDPNFTPAMMMLGLAAYVSGDEGLAIQFLENAHELEPERKEFVDLLAAILPRAGRVSDSLYYGKLSVALESDPILSSFVPRELSSYKSALDQARVSSHSMAAELALRAGQYHEALRQSDEELRINANNAEALIISARSLMGLGKARAAVNTLRAAAHVAPRSGWLHGWFAAALIASGHHADAVPHLRWALDGLPNDKALVTLVAGLTEWLDDANWAATADLREHLVKTVTSGRGTRTPDRLPQTKMIGVLSDQIHESSMSAFVLPVLKEMGNSVLYRNNQRHDSETQSFHHAALRVRECAEVDNFTLGRTMIGDQLNVLFYLGAPTHESKYVNFAGVGGPAAVQWISDPLVDRLPTAEIVVGDQETADVDEKNFGADGVVLLDHMVACSFSELPAEDEKVGPLPRDGNGDVTFGVWGDMRRFTPQAIALWSQCLLAVSGSSLLIGGRGIWEDGVLQDLHDRFAEFGVGPRIRIHTQSREFESPLAFLAGVDVLLDAVPVSAGAEVAQTLWMGVPVITMKGPRRAGRFGASVLRAAGFPQWIAQTEAEYVTKAAEMATASDLGAIRAGLRETVLASPLAAPKDMSKKMMTAVLSKVANGVPGR